MKKYAHSNSSPSSSSVPPRKSNTAKDFPSIQALPLAPSTECESLVERPAAKDSIPSTPSESRSRLFQQSEQADLLAPFNKEFAKHVQKDNLTDLDAHNLGELVNTIQRIACQLSTASIIYKFRVTSYDKNIIAENQSLKKKLESENEQSTKFHTDILWLEEKVAKSKSKALQLERELSSIKDELINTKKVLVTQKYAFEQHLEAQTSRQQGRISTLEKLNINKYNSRLTYCYDCIMYVLKTKNPELNMDKLEADVTIYMNEH